LNTFHATGKALRLGSKKHDYEIRSVGMGNRQNIEEGHVNASL